MNERKLNEIREKLATDGRPVSVKEAVFGENPPPVGRLLVYLVVVLTLICILAGCDGSAQSPGERMDARCGPKHVYLFKEGVCVTGFRP